MKLMIDCINMAGSAKNKIFLNNSNEKENRLMIF